MKQRLFLLLFALSVIANAFAGARSEQDALEIARSFLQNSNATLRSSSSTEDISLVYTCSNVLRSVSETTPYYYVFNYGNDTGFVIVSGNDEAKEILGYSGQGSFDISNLPANFENWLAGYQKEIDELYQSTVIKYADKTTSTSQIDATYAAVISPLLGSILWDQDSPYNDLCPAINQTGTKAATGCVATAMAQIMYYYKYPAQGTGTFSYTTDVRKIAINETLSAYDWGNMLPYYNSSGTDTQKNAVAKLMYHCGVATYMDYDTESGAYTTDAAYALKTNFGYNKNLQYLWRDYTPINEWTNLIKTELNAGRPVFYSGSSSGGAHAFVCDGYDTNNLFHFNWGWSGVSNGYFQLTALNPSQLGTGGGAGGGYNYSQAIITGIQKTTSGTAVAPSFAVGSISTTATSISRNGTFSLSATNIYNLGIDTTSVKLGFALYDGNDNFVRNLALDVIGSFAPGYGYSTFGISSLNASSAIPQSLSAGDYKIYIVALYNNDTERSICKAQVGITNHIKVNVSSSRITFTNPDDSPNLQLVSAGSVGTLYNGKTGRFTVTIKNNGSEYDSNIWLRLVSTSNSNTSRYIVDDGDPFSLAAGATGTFETSGTISLAAGSYNLYVYYDKYNDNSDTYSRTQLGNPVAVTISAASTESSALTLTQAASFSDPNNVNMFDVSLSPKIKNTGGYFENYVIAFVYNLAVSDYSVASFGYQKLILDQNEEKEVNFSGILSTLDLDTEYMVVLYSGYSSNWKELTPSNRITFKLIAPTAIENITQGKTGIYPNPVTDKLFLRSEDVVKSIRIVDLSGKTVVLTNPDANGEILVPVENLDAGSYILHSETDKEVKNYKFIKK